MTKKGFTLIEVIVSIIILSIVLVFSTSLFINFRHYYLKNKNEQKIKLYRENITNTLGRIFRDYPIKSFVSDGFCQENTHDIRFYIETDNDIDTVESIDITRQNFYKDDGMTPINSKGYINIAIYQGISQTPTVLKYYVFNDRTKLKELSSMNYFKCHKEPLDDNHPIAQQILKKVPPNGNMVPKVYLVKVTIPITSEEGGKHDINLFTPVYRYESPQP